MDELIRSIYDTPGDWTCGEFIFKHRSGVKIWHGNGLLTFQITNTGRFNLFQRVRAYVAFRWWLKHAPIENIS